MVDLSGWRFNFAFGAFDQANFDLEEMSTAHFCDGGRKRQHRSNARNLEQLSGGYENERYSNGFKIISSLIFFIHCCFVDFIYKPACQSKSSSRIRKRRWPMPKTLPLALQPRKRRRRMSKTSMSRWNELESLALLLPTELTPPWHRIIYRGAIPALGRTIQPVQGQPLSRFN